MLIASASQLPVVVVAICRTRVCVHTWIYVRFWLSRWQKALLKIGQKLPHNGPCIVPQDTDQTPALPHGCIRRLRRIIAEQRYRKLRDRGFPRYRFSVSTLFQSMKIRDQMTSASNRRSTKPHWPASCSSLCLRCMHACMQTVSRWSCMPAHQRVFWRESVCLADKILHEMAVFRSQSRLA